MVIKKSSSHKSPKFSETPRPSIKSRVRPASDRDGLTADVRIFKATYIHERRVLETSRGEPRLYVPAKSLDGIAKSNSIEDKKPKNAWIETYNKLVSQQLLKELKLKPETYVRILFQFLQGTSVATPTLQRLASSDMQVIVADGMADRKPRMQGLLFAQGGRCKSDIIVNTRGYGYSLALSVYYAILDDRLGLSSLFCYCIAKSTAADLPRNTEANCRDGERLEQLAIRLELPAAMEYTLFPDMYDEIWGDVIPEAFKRRAVELLRVELDRCSNV